MNTADMIDIMGKYGMRCSRRQFLTVYDYLEAMRLDNRIVAIYEESEPIGFLAFSICFDFEPYYNKPTFTYLSHEPTGPFAYIEKLVCREWTKEIRRGVEGSIRRAHPSVLYGIWHRYKSEKDHDIKVTSMRRSYVSN